MDCMIISALPVIRQKNAGRSNFHMKVSLRQHMASPALIMIAEAELTVSKVISAKGRTPKQK